MKCDGRKPDPEKWTESDKELIANILDQKGNLTIRRPSAPGGLYNYDPRLSYTEKGRVPIELCEEYGGTWHDKPKGSGKYTWYISRNNKLLRVLQAIEPYIKLKDQKVKYAIELLFVLRDKPRNWREKCEKIYNAMKALRKK